MVGRTAGPTVRRQVARSVAWWVAQPVARSVGWTAGQTGNEKAIGDKRKSILQVHNRTTNEKNMSYVTCDLVRPNQRALLFSTASVGMRKGVSITCLDGCVEGWRIGWLEGREDG
jgi:hypothetical protein